MLKVSIGKPDTRSLREKIENLGYVISWSMYQDFYGNTHQTDQSGFGVSVIIEVPESQIDLTICADSTYKSLGLIINSNNTVAQCDVENADLIVEKISREHNYIDIHEFGSAYKEHIKIGGTIRLETFVNPKKLKDY